LKKTPFVSNKTIQSPVLFTLQCHVQGNTVIMVDVDLN